MYFIFIIRIGHCSEGLKRLGSDVEEAIATSNYHLAANSLHEAGLSICFV